MKQGEGIHVEFKACSNKLSKEVFETVCAFLNRSGGELFLGVNDNGKIIGIEKNMIYAENSNKPHGHGLIDPANFSPFPKNPVIAKFFKEIGRADELGSGVRNLFKYCKIYSNKVPQMIEEDVFKTIIPLPGKSAKQDGKKEIVPSLSQVCPKSVPSGDITKILKKTTLFVSITELMKVASQTNRTRFRNQIIRPLIKAGLISMANPKKPKSPKQKYIITEKGKAIISKNPAQKKK
jgi:ATP-dependent DNA helicase RecG